MVLCVFVCAALGPLQMFCAHVGKRTSVVGNAHVVIWEGLSIVLVCFPHRAEKIA